MIYADGSKRIYCDENETKFYFCNGHLMSWINGRFDIFVNKCIYSQAVFF